MRFSPQNKYADEYYKAYHNFNNVRDELIKIKNNPNAGNAKRAEKLQKTFEELDAKMPQQIHRAKLEENRIVNAERKNVTPKGVGEKLDLMG
jgi:DNA repair ATPase RecN